LLFRLSVVAISSNIRLSFDNIRLFFGNIQLFFGKTPPMDVGLEENSTEKRLKKRLRKAGLDSFIDIKREAFFLGSFPDS
jgi:hypothetical protein